MIATGTPTAPGSGAPAPNTTDATSPSSDGVTKDKRRQSFFGTLAGKKERKTDLSSDNESAGGKLGGMFRRASRSTKASSAPATDASIPPAPLSKDVVAAKDSALAGEASATPLAESAGKSAPEETTHQTNKPERASTAQPTEVSASA